MLLRLKDLDPIVGSILMDPRSSLLCSIGEGGGGDAGGGGGGGGTGDGGDGGDGGKQGLNEDTKKFIANTVNSSVASFMKRDSFKNAIAEVVQASVGDAIKSAMAEVTKPNPGEGEGGKGGKGGTQPDPRDAEIAKMRAEQDKLRKQMEKNAAEAQAEKDKSRTQAERAALTDALRKGGVDDSRIGAAVAYIYLDKKLVAREAETDKIVMRFEREWGEELVPIEKGAVEYLKSDAGKVFLPPVEASGSGNKGGRTITSKPGEKPTRTELLTHLGNQMLSGGQVPGR